MAFILGPFSLGLLHLGLHSGTYNQQIQQIGNDIIGFQREFQGLSVGFQQVGDRFMGLEVFM